jgi:hypothetical protein
MPKVNWITESHIKCTKEDTKNCLNKLHCKEKGGFIITS